MLWNRIGFDRHVIRKLDGDVHSIDARRRVTLAFKQFEVSRHADALGQAARIAPIPTSFTLVRLRCIGSHELKVAFGFK